MNNHRFAFDQPCATVYPAIGAPVDGGRWRIGLSGFVWREPEEFNRRQRMMIGMLRNVMGVSTETLQSSIFADRINQFMAPACAKLTLEMKIGEQRFPLRKKTKRNGRFVDAVQVPGELLEPLIQQTRTVPTAKFELLSPELDASLGAGEILLYPQTGVSVISDIDDTIKESQVGNRKELLANTFLREFRSVEGMAELYRSWSDLGAAFHYVSSSPWQLYSPLRKFSDDCGFPMGTMHLRNFRLRDQLLRKLVLRRNGKVLAIRHLLTALPQRTFILIGDSGEKDPKIYRKICREFPGRVKAVFIRDMEFRPFDADRQLKLSRSLPQGICSGFVHAGRLRQLAAPVFENS